MRPQQEDISPARRVLRRTRQDIPNQPVTTVAGCSRGADSDRGDKIEQRPVPEVQSAAPRPGNRPRNSSNSPHRCQARQLANPHIDENFHTIPQLTVRQKLRPRSNTPTMWESRQCHNARKRKDGPLALPVHFFWRSLVAAITLRSTVSIDMKEDEIYGNCHAHADWFSPQ